MYDINSGLAPIMASLNTLDADGARAAYNAMSGEIHASLATIDIENNEQFLRTVSQHLQSQVMMRQCAEDPQFPWNAICCATPVGPLGAQAMGTDANLGSDGKRQWLALFDLRRGSRRRTTIRPQHSARRGRPLTPTRIRRLDDRNDDGSISGGKLAVYLNHDFETCYVTGHLPPTVYNRYTTTRSIEFGAIDRTAPRQHRRQRLFVLRRDWPHAFPARCSAFNRISEWNMSEHIRTRFTEEGRRFRSTSPAAASRPPACRSFPGHSRGRRFSTPREARNGRSKAGRHGDMSSLKIHASWMPHSPA